MPLGRPAHSRTPCRAGARWLRRALLGVGVILALMAGLLGSAWTATDTSMLARVLAWRQADIGDQYRFPARTIPTGNHPSALPAGAEVPLRARDFLGVPDRPLADALGASDTRAFVVVRHGRIVYERYLDGVGPQTRETSFSVSKSFVSTLIGIAIAQRRIDSVDDPITDYLPELARKDPRFARVTLADLLTMTSGLAYHESALPWPFGDDTFTYLGTDLRRVALDRSRIEEPPGTRWLYNNYNPLLLGLALERATGMSVSAYMSRVLWRPLGAARGATWNQDSTASGFEKMESGLNATARDYARFGLLFLHEGRANGRQIVPAAWVRAATAPRAATRWGNPYGYFWWVDGQRPVNYFAFGNYGQYIYVAPHADTVIVRTGSDWNTDNPHWLALFRDLTDQLMDAGRPQ